MSIDKMSRVEDILHATLGDISESELQPPQSRVEALLQRLEDKIDEISEGGGKLPIHICTSSEYNPLTGIPTIQNPVEDTFYLVPDGTGNNLYTEWIYTNGVWDYVGGTNSTGGDGSVHYDTAQSLSDGDKARARLNISAAEAEDVDELKSHVGELDAEVGLTFEMAEDDAILELRKLTGKADLAEDANGTRLRIVFDCRNVVPIDALISCSFGPFYVGEWSTLAYAVNSDPNVGAVKILTSAYVTSPVSGTIESDGFLCVSIRKADNSAFTDAEKDAALAALSVSLTCKSTATQLDTIENDISEIDNDIKKLYIGELINGHLTASGTNTTAQYAPYRLSTHEVVAFPSRARKFTVRIADGYLVAMRSGAAANNLEHNLFWFADGDVITVPEGDNYYGISVCRAYVPTSYITVKIYPRDAEKMRLSLCYDAFPESGNPDAEKVLNAARLTFNSTAPNNLSTIPLIAHTSDCHGDFQRVKNFLNFCDKVGVSASCITGDITAYTPAQGLSWFSALVNNAKSLCGVCIGNHDVYDNAMTDEQAYAFVFEAIASKIGNNTGKTYYYTDIAAAKIRLVSVNLYEYGGATRNYTHFTNAQLAWLCETLAGTPAGYGVILLYHSPQVNVSTAQSAGYSTFFQSVRKYNNIYSGVTGSPINDIIDAFIARATLTKTYAQTGNPASVSVSADFSGVDSTVEFIAHLTGHFHQDTVCYVPGTTAKQLMLNVVCTNSLYGGTVYPYLCDLTDLPRNISDATQDSFNVYAIDRANKTVKVIRVGSDTTYEMQPRKYMAIPYAD